MNPEVKQKWVDALRSGEYQQDRHRLKSLNGFCCLGVLSDLYLKEKKQDWEQHDIGYYAIHGKTTALHYKVSDWCDFPNGEVQQTLITMNDKEEKTFQEIADFIEENL